MNVAISRKNIIWLLMDIGTAKKTCQTTEVKKMNVAAIAKDALASVTAVAYATVV